MMRTRDIEKTSITTLKRRLRMNRLSSTFVLSTIFSLSLNMTSISDVNAATRFALTCVVNRTSAIVGYSWKYDVPQNQWRSGRLGPGQSYKFWYQYEHVNQNRSPHLLINFDADVSARQYRQQYRLEAFASPDTDCANGKHYMFVQDGNGYIDIRGE